MNLILPITSERQLVAAALHLGARSIAGWSVDEESIAQSAGDFLPPAYLANQIRSGHDPLGEALLSLRSAETRRAQGATYTPPAIVGAMLDWARTRTSPSRIVEPGCGSGRFLMEAGRCFPNAELIGVESDPTAAMLARANLAAAGFGARSYVLVGDFREVALRRIDGATLFVGNPPYVRHHLIEPHWKEWLTRTTRELGVTSSQLAGLHVYFLVAVARLAQKGDFGSFITSAEWLDVNYGRALRELFLRNLGGESILIVEPSARPFPDVASTAALFTFDVGTEPPSIRVARTATTSEYAVGEGSEVRRERLVAESRWSYISRPQSKVPADHVELGEICRVHRGQVTGANRVWIAACDTPPLPSDLLFRSVTRARELIEAGSVLRDAVALRSVIDLPVDLDVLDAPQRRMVETFLRWARRIGAHSGYVATHRKAWWSVGLRVAPPILATYMARRPPAFVVNKAGARYINIAHGLFPREQLTGTQITGLASYLSRSVTASEARVYAGGLMKFEPREMERLLVPLPYLLPQHATA